MNQHLTICYSTCRKDPKIEWFITSLARQIKPEDLDNISIIVVDLFAETEGRLIYHASHSAMGNRLNFVRVTPPKPNVWQGEYRLTSSDWFAASNARNTALCLAPDGYIAYVDDLSVLLPGWLDRVKAAMAGGHVVCGAYRKVNKMVVENGELISFADHHAGNDSRARFAKSDLHPCEGGWLFGCSCAMPVEALLTIGGWPEYVDGMGSEDSLCGIALQNVGIKMFYDRKMMTYESEELHHAEPGLGRTDKGKSPDDKSHRALNIVLSGQNYFDNYYDGGIRAEREKVLRGEPFTIRQIPDRDWFDGQLVSEMTPVPKIK
jgi:glycosyltransferase involved in cell wall biosynthesis